MMKNKLKKITITIFIFYLMFCSTLISTSAATLENYFSDLNKEGNFYGEAFVSRVNENGYDVILDQGFDSLKTNQQLSSDTIFNVASISKIFTTAAILHLEQDGMLNIDDSIDKYLEDVPSDKKDITISMLLTHSSGITEPESEDLLTKDENLDRILSSELTYTPGDNYSYSNSGFNLLAYIIESASNTTFENYIYESIIYPLNLQDTGFPQDGNLDESKGVIGYADYENTGNVVNNRFGWESKGFTDQLTTPKDLTTFLYALFNGEIINQEEIDKMVNPYFETNYGVFRGLGIVITYDEFDNPIYSHTGSWYGGNSFFAYRPADDLIVTDFTNNIVFGNEYPASNAGYDFLEEFPVNSLNNEQIILTYTFKDVIERKNNISDISNLIRIN